MISVARLVTNATGFNTVNLLTAVIYLQKHPGKPNPQTGIAGLEYKVESDGVIIQSGTSAADGKIEVRCFPGTKTVLKVMGCGYEVSVSNAAFTAVNTHQGRKERLRYLGYQIGHYGTNKDGVDDDSIARYEYERSVCDFQSDQGNTHNADPTTIDAALTADAGA